MMKIIEPPTVEQVAWVFQQLHAHLVEGGTFKTLIYDRLGYTSEAYEPLYLAGGFVLSNVLNEYRRIGMREESPADDTTPDRRRVPPTHSN
jgi:hypothetical protein